jgi:ATP-dependent RNA helicase RhlE
LTLFTNLGLAEPIVRALAEERYETPTPIQAAAIPPAVAGRDVVGIAQTGTGKTAAFALPLLHRLGRTEGRPWPKAPRVVVLCPTRELGGQIVDSFRAYGRHLRLKVALAIGGVPINRQIRTLAQGIDVLVATPGRLLDLAGERAVQFDRVEVLVLDEADRMLDMGFIRDIRKLVGMMPSARQTLFFSATMPAEISQLADQMLRDPVKVAVTPAATTVELIEQRAIRVDRAAKPDLLVSVLKGEAVERALVFTRTKHGADRVVRGLNRAGIPAEAIHGNKSQGNRERTMAAFRSGAIRTLVATDIAARGIDVDGVSHVVNFDLPNIPDTYVHRIGRTARAGASGIAISLVSPDEMTFLRDIEKLIRRQVPMSGDPVRATSSPAGEDDAGHRHEPRQKSRKGRRPHRRNDKAASQGGRDRQGQGSRDRHHQASRDRAQLSRPHRGDNIADVGFMAERPRRPGGGMAQGSGR